MLTVAVAVLVPSPAVTVYTVATVAAVGVPEMTPVAAPITRPSGRVGWIVKVVGVPPRVGLIAVMGESRGYTIGEVP